MQYTIGIDCAPGNPRPGDLIDAVIKDTGLPSRETVSRSFGAWVWDYSDVEGVETIWANHSARINDRLITLFEMGRIRGAELSPAVLR